jgi:hypothetical protein
VGVGVVVGGGCGGLWGCGGVGVYGCGGVGCGAVWCVVVWWVWGVWFFLCVFPLRSNIPRSALCATLDTYNFIFIFLQCDVVG